MNQIVAMASGYAQTGTIFGESANGRAGSVAQTLFGTSNNKLRTNEKMASTSLTVKNLIDDLLWVAAVFRSDHPEVSQTAEAGAICIKLLARTQLEECDHEGDRTVLNHCYGFLERCNDCGDARYYPRETDGNRNDQAWHQRMRQWQFGPLPPRGEGE